MNCKEAIKQKAKYCLFLLAFFLHVRHTKPVHTCYTSILDFFAPQEYVLTATRPLIDAPVSLYLFSANVKNVGEGCEIIKLKEEKKIVSFGMEENNE